MNAHFIELQMKWYAALAKDGFQDIEDITDPHRPLVKWSGVSHNGLVESERAELPLWPESPFLILQELLYHSELSMVCESICKHGNHSLTPCLVKKVLEMQIQGMTCRKIGKILDISYVAVFRTQKKLSEWALLIESRQE